MRPSLDQYMMEIAKLAATRTTCIRRGVGCVLTNSHGHILAVGYNGVAAGMPHCNERTGFEDTGCSQIVGRELFAHACKDQGIPGRKTPEGKASCEAVHAEQNALLQCSDPWKIDTAYITRSPCTSCMKLLLNTSCKRIIFLENCSDSNALQMWRKAGREILYNAGE